MPCWLSIALQLLDLAVDIGGLLALDLDRWTARR